jgi:pimeloyl-ACP methyl ester carboxylesterase
VSTDPAPFSAEHDGVRLSAEQSGRGAPTDRRSASEGPPIVLLHGLTATRRYVVMGSRSLERSGHRVIAYDARGHGQSAPAREPAAYTYELLDGDLEAVLDAAGVQPALRWELTPPCASRCTTPRESPRSR